MRTAASFRECNIFGSILGIPGRWGPYDRYKCSEITPKKMAENITDVKTTLLIGVSSLHLQLDAVLTL